MFGCIKSTDNTEAQPAAVQVQHSQIWASKHTDNRITFHHDPVNQQQPEMQLTERNLPQQGFCKEHIRAKADEQTVHQLQAHAYPEDALRDQAAEALALQHEAKPDRDNLSRWAMHPGPDYSVVEHSTHCPVQEDIQAVDRGPLRSSTTWNASTSTPRDLDRSQAWEEQLHEPQKKRNFRMPAFEDPGKATALRIASPDGAVALRFPEAGESSAMHRKCQIRDNYETSLDYLHDCSQAVEEEIGLRQG